MFQPIPSNNSHFMPYGIPKYDIKMKLLQVDPYTGLWINILKGEPGSELGIHRHYDQVYGYTLKGGLGDIVHETPGSVHTLYIDQNHGEKEVLFFVWDALEYLDENGKTLFIEDWRSIAQKYVVFCVKNNFPIVDINYPKEKIPDVHSDEHHKTDL